MRIWIDTDVGSDVDDALAIAYALRHPQLELVGISTVFGDVSLRTRIAKRLVETAAVPDLPVVTGLGVPLTAGRIGRMFGHEGRGVIPDAAPRMVTDSDPEAERRIEVLAQTIAATRPDALLAIGPMTNLGALSRAGHLLPPITAMGGKLTDVLLPGMIPQIPEWNWWCDPSAVVSALSDPQRMPPRIVPAEVTFRTSLGGDDRARLAQGDALARQLARLCDHWLEAQRDRFGAKEPGVKLHDPLAAVTLAEPGVVSFESRRIRVNEDGGARPDPQGISIDVAGAVDNAALCEHLMEVWLG